MTHATGIASESSRASGLIWQGADRSRRRHSASVNDEGVQVVGVVEAVDREKVHRRHDLSARKKIGQRIDRALKDVCCRMGIDLLCTFGAAHVLIEHCPFGRDGRPSLVP